jgi:hypothetical protein
MRHVKCFGSTQGLQSLSETMRPYRPTVPQLQSSSPMSSPVAPSKNQAFPESDVEVVTARAPRHAGYTCRFGSPANACAAASS